MSDDKPEVRLCLASPSFFPTYGGAQLRFLRYLPGLKARGVETEVLTGTPTLKEASGCDIKEEWLAYRPGEVMPTEDINGASVIRMRLPDKKGRARTRIFNNTVLRFCHSPQTRPDVVQLVTNLVPRSTRFLKRLRRMGIPVVYAVTIAPVERSKKPFKRFRRKAAYRSLYNQLDCIVTNNAPLRDMVREMGVRTRIEVIPNGVDLERFHPDQGDGRRHALRESLGIADTDVVICAVGAIIPRKGIDRVVEAWAALVARFPNLHLLLVGPEAHLEHPKLGPFRERIEHLIASSATPRQVHFTGTVDDVEDYQRAADICVLASEREGMPNSVLEAMATAVPVVLTPFVGLSSDLGRPGEHYLLAEPDAGGLAARLGDLVEDPDLRRELGQRGRQWVEEAMDLNKTLDRYTALYRELAARGR